MTTIVTTATASDFLALVPRLVGFQPQNSVVFVAFRGNRTCGAMRFDLPADGSSRFHKRIATSLVGMLSKLPGVDAVVPVVYTDDRFRGDDGSAGMPRREFVDALAARFRFSGFAVRDALCVAEDGWGSFLDPDCPPEGRALDVIESSRVLDSVPEQDRRPLGDLGGWASLPEVSPEARLRVARSVEKFDALLADARADTARPAIALRAILDDLPGMLEDIIGRGAAVPDHLAAAFVIAISRSPAIRDVVMLQWAFDLDTGDRVLDDADRFARGAAPSALGSAPLMLGRGPRPDPQRVELAISTLKAITALAPEQARAPLYCMLAWLNWALGRSSVAHLFVTEAERIDPDYGFADLLRTVLERGILPEWAFASS